MHAVSLIGGKYLQNILPILGSATSTIDIIIYEWRIYPSRPTHPVSIFNAALKDAAARGVKIRALVGSEALRDVLKQMKIEARCSYSGKLLHAKMLLIDKNISVLGSHNFTQSAFTQNIEVSAAIYSPEICAELSTYFDNLFGL